MSKLAFVTPDIKTWLENFKYKTSFRTRFGETDAFGHINNVSYFSYFEQARINYFEELQLFEHLGSLSPILSKSENMVVTASLECNYLAQLYYGQDIDIYVRTAKIGNSSFDLEYAIVEKHSGTVAAVGQGAIVYINRIKNKSEALPEIAKEKIREYEFAL